MWIRPSSFIVEGLKNILPYEKYDVPSLSDLVRGIVFSLFRFNSIPLQLALSIKYGNVNESPSSVRIKSGSISVTSFAN